VQAERRTIEEIRGEIASEREQLEHALVDLRRGIDRKRKPAVALGSLLAAGLATALAVKVARRIRGG